MGYGDLSHTEVIISHEVKLSGIYETEVWDKSYIPLNTYRTAVSPTLDLLCHEDFNVERSEAESNIEIFMAQ